MKKKVSILVNSFSQGGAERVISLFLPELVKDFDVTLFLCYDLIAYPIPKEVNTIVLLPNDGFKQSPISKFNHFFKTKKAYSNYLKSEKIEVAISFLAFSNIINGAIKKMIPGLKTIISERCYPSLMYKNSKVSWMIAKNILPKFYNKNDILFSNSIEINKDLKTNFDITIPTEVIYNPITSSMDYKNYTLDLDESFKLVNVGSIYTPKNQKLIIDAISLNRNKNIQFTIYGDGPLEQELKLQIDTKNLNNQVHFSGRVNNIQKHLLKHDCFVLSSNTEGFPNVLLEAMSVGLACISTNCQSGPLELLNEAKPLSIDRGTFAKAKYGLMIQVNDELGLSKAISYLNEHPEECEKYGKLALKRSKDFDLSIIYEQLKKLINS